MLKQGLLALAAAIAVTAPAVHAQGQAGASAFPSRTIRIQVPFAAGSGADSTSRVYGEIVSKLLGQPVVVENRPGGSGLVAIQAVKAAPPDGHTILMASNSPMAVNPVVMKNPGYDAFKDFRPVHGASVGPAAFAVRGDSPVRSVAELFALARKENRPLAVGNYSAGYQLIGAWLGVTGNVAVNHVPYKGGSQMLTDVIGGQVDVGVIDFSGLGPLLKEGRLRALAITGDKRNPQYPDVPTMKEGGFADFETYVWASFFVRAETPDDVVDKLASAFRKALLSDEGKAFQQKSASTPLLLGPKELGEFHVREFERFKRVAEAAGIRPE